MALAVQSFVGLGDPRRCRVWVVALAPEKDGDTLKHHGIGQLRRNAVSLAGRLDEEREFVGSQPGHCNHTAGGPCQSFFSSDDQKTSGSLRMI